MKNKKSKIKISLLFFIPLVFLFLFLSFFFKQKITNSATTDNVAGWAWSENIGWSPLRRPAVEAKSPPRRPAVEAGSLVGDLLE